MDKETVDLDEEMTEHDSLWTEPLSEPQLLLLSSPPAFLPGPGEPTMPWDRWHKSFENYMEALGDTELVDSTKCMLLQNCLGKEGQRVYTTLIQGETTYAATISALRVHFSSGHNPLNGLTFQQRAQRPGETVEQFVCALAELVKILSFRALQEMVILNQLIEKTSCTPLRERLLVVKGTLTLAEALVIGKQVESASLSGDGGERPFRRVAKRGRPRKLQPHVTITCDDGDPAVPRVAKKRGRPKKLKPQVTKTGDNEDSGEHLFQRVAKRGRPRKLQPHVTITCDKGDPAVPRVAKRGRPKKLKPHVNITPSSRSGGKDDCYYSISEEHYGDSGDKSDPDYDADHGGESGDKSDPDYDEALGHGGESGDKSEDKSDPDYDADHGGETDPDYDEVLGHGGKSGDKSDPDYEAALDNGGESGDENDPDYDEALDDDDDGDSGDNKNDPDYEETEHDDDGGGSDAEQVVISETKSKIQCTLCDKSFHRAWHLGRHMMTHTNERPFSCPVCALTFRRTAHLSKHVSTQHGAGHHICTKCGETFGSLVDLEAHKESHGRPDILSSPDYIVFGGCDAKKEEEGPECGADEMEDEDCNEADDDDDADAQERVSSKTKKTEHICPVCDDKCFQGPAALARHMRVHTKEKPFSCRVCHVTFSHSYHMTRHLRIQHGFDKHICTKCGQSFGSWVELKTHKWTHGILSCPGCEKTFTDKSELITHIKKHNSKVQSIQTLRLICTECGKMFNRMNHMRRHLATHGKTTKTQSPEELKAHMESRENIDNPYLCTVCGRRFKLEYALKKHEQGHNEEQYHCTSCDLHFSKLSHYNKHLMVHARQETKCPHCDKVFLKLAVLKRHLQTHLEERPHRCPLCIETFTSKDDLEQHCLRHRKFKKEKPYSCSRCDKAFSSLPELTEHMSSHQGEQPQNCPTCGKIFLNKNKLEKHLSIHTGERPHLCNVCGSGFTNETTLKKHLRIHAGDKPFKCSQCSRSFIWFCDLRSHSRQHMADRPTFPCRDCGKTYGRMSELKKHQREHTGDKPYACTCCHKRFIDRHKLNVHMRTHTGERPYACSHCGQTFTQGGDKQRHIRKYHKKELS